MYTLNNTLSSVPTAAFLAKGCSKTRLAQFQKFHTRSKSFKCHTSASILERDAGQVRDGRVKVSWPDAYEELIQYKESGEFRSLSPGEACSLWEEVDPLVFVDVNKPEDFEILHAIGCINIPLFVPIEGNSGVQMQRKALFALSGNFNGTEENPDFIETFEVQCDENKDIPVMIICGIGGDLIKTDRDPSGKRSKSLVAAHMLIRAGFTKVYWVEEGVNGWLKAGLPSTLTHDEVF